MLSMTQGMLYIGSTALMSGGFSGRVSGIGVNKGTGGNKGSSSAGGLGEFKYDFINLPEGNLGVITPST